MYLGMVYAMSSIGVLGFIVWAQWWARNIVIYWKKTWLYAGTPIKPLITRINLFNAVKILMLGQSAGNQQIDNSILVGSSETTCHALDLDLNWAIGFFEAEGILKVLNNRVYIGISQSTNNIKSLYRIKKIFGLGKVKIRKDSRYADWKLTGTLNQRITFINLINGKLITSKRNLELNELIIYFNNKHLLELNYLGPKNLTLDNSWLTGFIEGDGNFNMKIRPHTVAVRISISQKEKDILTSINNLFPGSISESINPNLHYKYSAGSIQTRNLWIHYFDKFPLKTNKNVSYKRWLKCHHLVIKGLHKTPEGLIKIKSIISQDEDIVQSS